MNRKIDKKALCQDFNGLRQNQLHKKFTAEEYYKLLKKLGISKNYANLISRTDSVRSRRNGTGTEYCFTEIPLHVSKLESIYSKYSSASKESVKKLTPIEEAIALLKENGYRIFKEEGINEAALKKELPKLYKKYVITKEV